MATENDKTLLRFNMKDTSETDLKKRKEHYETQAENFLEALKIKSIKEVKSPTKATQEDKKNFIKALKDKNTITIPAPKEGENAMTYYQNVMKKMESGELFGGAEKKQGWYGNIVFEDKNISPEIHQMIDSKLKVKDGALKGTSDVSVSRAREAKSEILKFINNVIQAVQKALTFTIKDEEKEAESKLQAITQYAIKNSKKEVGLEPLSNKSSNEVDKTDKTLNSKIEKNEKSQLDTKITKTNASKENTQAFQDITDKHFPGNPDVSVRPGKDGIFVMYGKVKDGVYKHIKVGRDKNGKLTDVEAEIVAKKSNLGDNGAKSLLNSTNNVVSPEDVIYTDEDFKKAKYTDEDFKKAKDYYDELKAKFENENVDFTSLGGDPTQVEELKNELSAYSQLAESFKGMAPRKLDLIKDENQNTEAVLKDVKNSNTWRAREVKDKDLTPEGGRNR